MEPGPAGFRLGIVGLSIAPPSLATMSPVSSLAALIGTPEPALRLFLGVLLTYPLGALYRKLFLSPACGKTLAKAAPPTTAMHLFSVSTGGALAYFIYGSQAVYLFWPPLVVWALLWALPRRSLVTSTLVLGWTFLYLMCGYWFFGTENYDIDWTTSFCVMCLRLLGFSMDYRDGATQKPKSDNAASQQPSKNGVWDNVALARLPSLLELYAYCFFFGGFATGPQFPFKVYDRFVRLKLFAADKEKPIVVPSATWYTLRCFLLGAGYVAASEIGKGFFPTSYLTTVEFAQSSFLYRVVASTLGGRVVFAKYLGIWLLAEGGCSLSGISFNGYSSGKKALWNALSNVDVALYETAAGLSDIVLSFNTNTNLWSKQYVFKRLRFLGSKELSAFGTLMFLAAWHGFNIGYYLIFFTEFVDMEAERRLQRMLPNWLLPQHTSGVWGVIVRGMWMAWTMMMLSYAGNAFDLLVWRRIVLYWGSVNYFGHVIVFSIIIADLLRAKLFKKRSGKNKRD